MSGPHYGKRSPWYAEGLRFECRRCGDCCTGDPGDVWVGCDEIRRLAEFLRLDVGGFSSRYLRYSARGASLLERADGDCVLLGEEDCQCTVHQVRPDQCRSWPFWTENIADPRAWERAAKLCRGMNSGRLFSVEEIERLRM